MTHSEEYEKILDICLKNQDFDQSNKEKLIKELDFMEEHDLLKNLWSLHLQRESANESK